MNYELKERILLFIVHRSTDMGIVTLRQGSGRTVSDHGEPVEPYRYRWTNSYLLSDRSFEERNSF
jgi:hypothetical protein